MELPDRNYPELECRIGTTIFQDPSLLIYGNQVRIWILRNLLRSNRTSQRGVQDFNTNSPIVSQPGRVSSPLSVLLTATELYPSLTKAGR